MSLHLSLARSLHLSLLIIVVAACTDQPRDVDDARLRDAGADSANWIMYGRTHDDQRYSPLAQVNEGNVAQLGLAWSHELTSTRGLEATPLVEDGVMYTTGVWSVVYALDARTGATRWTYDPKVNRTRTAFFLCCDAVNRGVALYRGNVYVAANDGRLIALDSKTGAPVWSVMTVDTTRPYAITGYPRIAKGMVLIGNAGAEFGVRGYVTAYDAATGAQRWRAYTVPGNPALPFESKAMEAAAKTWEGQWWEVGGGGTVWEGIVYDPALDLVYFGTGNPTAWYRAARGNGEPHDNLYASSIVALHASTGEYAWHFQTTPGDNFDYDATQPLMQADLTIAGRTRKVIMQANKNGFYYVLDRATGEFISGTPFVRGVSWATGLDSVGRPIEASNPGRQPFIASPNPGGGHNWDPMAFNPATGLVYLSAKSGTQAVHAPDTAWTYNPDRDNVGMDEHYAGPLYDAIKKLPLPTGELLAWDPVAHREAWRLPMPALNGSGLLTTAGNLVLQGRADGILAAYRATDGRKLWEFDAGTGIMAPPMTYLIDGVQYISLMVGWGGPDGLFNDTATVKSRPGYGRIVTFALGGKATLAPTPYGHPLPPQPISAASISPTVLKEGERLFATQCSFCHGVGAVAGPLPDLRYATPAVHEQFEAIVLGGARAPLGMPSFKKIFTREQVQQIHAYILARTNESARLTRDSVRGVSKGAVNRR